MRKLISVLTVERAHKDGLKELAAPPKTTMVTDEARTRAKELGIRLREEAVVPDDAPPVSKIEISENLVRLVVEKVIDRLPPEKRQLDVIKEVTTEVLMEYAK